MKGTRDAHQKPLLTLCRHFHCRPQTITSSCLHSAPAEGFALNPSHTSTNHGKPSTTSPSGVCQAPSSFPAWQYIGSSTITPNFSSKSPRTLARKGYNTAPPKPGLYNHPPSKYLPLEWTGPWLGDQEKMAAGSGRATLLGQCVRYVARQQNSNSL